jgi:hypothetical protein
MRPPGTLGVAGVAAARPGLGGVEQELLHVPGAGGAALGAQAAVQADVFVLDHHAAGLEFCRHIQVLVRLQRRRLQAAAQSASSPLVVKVMQSIGQMSTQASHSMQAFRG